MLCSAPQTKTALSGRVVNAVTHEPVRGAIVTMRVPLEGPFSESEVGYLTGASGRFTFTDPPRASVEISVAKTGWVRLIGHGIRMTKDIQGATFYTLVGLHALHVVAGLAWLALSSALGRGETLARIYWAFVVLLWPILFALVYLPWGT